MRYIIGPHRSDKNRWKTRELIVNTWIGIIFLLASMECRKWMVKAWAAVACSWAVHVRYFNRVGVDYLMSHRNYLPLKASSWILDIHAGEGWGNFSPHYLNYSLSINLIPYYLCKPWHGCKYINCFPLILNHIAQGPTFNFIYPRHGRAVHSQWVWLLPH